MLYEVITREDRQPVQQLRRTDRNILCEFVPDEPVARNAEREHQPDQRHPRNPVEPAIAPVAVEDELFDDVQEDRDDRRVGRISVQASHDTAQVPLFVRQVLDRRERRADTRAKKDQ